MPLNANGMPYCPFNETKAKKLSYLSYPNLPIWIEPDCNFSPLTLYSSKANMWNFRLICSNLILEALSVYVVLIKRVADFDKSSSLQRSCTYELIIGFFKAEFLTNIACT
jgi:hypothetical protein